MQTNRSNLADPEEATIWFFKIVVEDLPEILLS